MDNKFEKGINWKKVDAALAGTISKADDPDQEIRILMSVNKPGPGSIRWMRKIGVKVGPRTLVKDEKNIVTAKTTLDGVRRLSRREYVVHMSLSRQLTLAKDT